MAESGRLPDRGRMTVGTLRMPGCRDVTGLARGPQVTGRTDGMTGRTTGRACVIHGRRRPRRSDGMTATAGIGGHRCRVVCLRTSCRSTGGTDAIMTSGAITAGGDIAMSKRSRLPC